MIQKFDLAVIGSGFGGSLLALIARRLGKSVVLIEKDRHPRFAIGESSTPLANLLLEEIATRYRLPRLLPFCKWGSWQRVYPELPVGLKRGFSFFHHSFGRPFERTADRSNELLVAASPHDQIADTHWHRSAFDWHLVQDAQSEGVWYLDETDLREAREGTEEIALTGRRHGRSIEIAARFAVDATGPGSFLAKALGAAQSALPDFPETQALYSHFEGVGRLSNTLPCSNEHPPFPIDDAAVHHVFPGGWIWVLHFNNGLTSAGVAATKETASEFRLSEGEAGWMRLLAQLPSVAAQFAGSRAVRPFTYAPSIGFRAGQITGSQWALLPSAAGFVDPLLSTGFPLTLLGVLWLAEGLERDMPSAALASYARQTEKELLAAARLIGALYSAMDRPSLFSDLTLLYFAAASFAESARRLGKPELAPGFLLCAHSKFGLAVREILADVNRSSSGNLRARIRAAIEPINVAGLGDPARLNWYGVDADDLLAHPEKLGTTRDDLEQLLDRAGFWEKCA